MLFKALKPFMFLLVVVAVVSLACITGTETPPPPPPAVEQPQDQPQQPEQPAEPPQPAQPSAQEFFKEEFDAGNENWSYFVVDGTKTVPLFSGDDMGTSELFTEDGYLIFSLVDPGQWVYVLYDPYKYKDVRLEAVAENRGTNDNNVSLICRYTEDEGWYEFNISNNGLYWIYHAIVNPENKVVYSLLADGGSTKIKQGKDVNTYAVTCEGRTLTLYINGIETRTLDDNNFVLRDGSVGVSVSSFKDLPVKVEFDSIEISQP